MPGLQISTFASVVIVFSSAKPLAVKLPGVFGPQDIKLVRSAQQRVLAASDNDHLMQRRNFGIGSDGTGSKEGHETSFLHEHLDAEAPHIRTKMLTWAREADQIAGWNTTRDFSIAARCFELLSYHGGERQNASDELHPASSSASHHDNEIGWHQDGATLITIAALLSNEQDYKGGALELKEGSAIERHELSRGDVIAWRGWTEHRVTPVIEGQRDIFVVEWWLGADCTETLEPRAGETTEELSQTLALDPSSPSLHRFLAESLCKQKPCGDQELESNAESHYRQALLLKPGDPVLLSALGDFLLGGGIFDRMDGARILHEAHSLNPNLVAAPEENVVALESVRWSCIQILWCVAVVAVLMVIIWVLDKFQGKSPSAQTVSAEPEAKSKQNQSRRKAGPKKD